MNVWDIALIAALAVGFGFALRHALRARKRGGCGCGCEGCAAKCGRRTNEE